MFITLNNFIEPCVGVVLKKCCVVTIDAFVFQAKEQINIIGCIPEGVRTR